MLVVIDQFTRRIVDFGLHAGAVDGAAPCHMFNTPIATQGVPHYLSSDNDALFRDHRRQADLRILEIQEVKSVPYVPLSHPFVDRLIGALHRGLLDHVFVWNANDLTRKLERIQQYYNAHRAHTSLNGDTPSEIAGEATCRWPTSTNTGGNLTAAGYASYP